MSTQSFVMSGLTQDDWPKFSATRHTPAGSEFRIGTRNAFVDLPNGLIHSAIARIHSLENDHETPESAFEQVQSEKDEINAFVRGPIQRLGKTECDWIDIQVKELPYSEKLYNIQIRTNWQKHLDFLNQVAIDRSIDFTDKYGYIFNCRNIRLLPKRGEPWISQSEKEKVREFSSQEIEESQELLTDLRGTVAQVARKCRQKNFIHLYYLYSKDCLHSLEHLETLLEVGKITSCYRELRNLLEELAVSLFYDKLVLEEREIGEPYNLPVPENKWFVNARNKKELLSNSSELKGCFSEYIITAHDHSPDSASKSEIWNQIVDNLNVSLFIAAASTKKNVSEFTIHGEIRDEIVERATRTTENTLLDILDSDTLSSSGKELAEEMTQNLLPHDGEFWIKFPTGFLARQFVGKTFPEDLNKPYDRYSHFIHAYPDSWQIAPSSSILEYKLFHTELGRITGKAERILQDFETLV